MYKYVICTFNDLQYTAYSYTCTSRYSKFNKFTNCLTFCNHEIRKDTDGEVVRLQFLSVCIIIRLSQHKSRHSCRN